LRFTCFLAIATVALVLPSPGSPDSPPPQPGGEKATNPAVECRVALNPNDSQIHLELVITDERLFRTLVEEPLKAARKEPLGSKHIQLGNLSLKRKDGRIENFGLFTRWGRVYQGEKWLLADLDGLRKEFQKAVKSDVPWLERGN
jgi:hypothetical protein